jgi:hypothetical protein
MELPLSEIKPYPNNARHHPHRQIARLCSSIRRFGFTTPIGLDDENIIIYGHGRYEAAKKLKLEKVPVIILTGLSEEEKSALRIADNRLTEMSNWDPDVLISELSALFDAEIDLSFLDLDRLLARDDPNQNDNQYTQKIGSIFYEPKNKKPELKSLYDDQKYVDLKTAIDQSTVDDETKKFLTLCATRHIRFRFDRIADFYAHSDEITKKLLRDQLAVIIDYDQAIEQGYIDLNEKINKLRQSDG